MLNKVSKALKKPKLPKRAEPKNWQKLWEGIEKMREKKDAPVDSMGCDECGDKNADKNTYAFQTLVALMLSSQTKDKQTFEATQRLKNHGLTVDEMIKIEEEELADLLYGVGFYKRKAGYIKRTSQLIKDKHEGIVPSKLDDILKFPGVGIKMALLLQQGAFGVVDGISVDTHVHRICNLLEWVDSTNPEATRVQLQDWLPKSKWTKINHMLVGFGQTICKPIAPLCDECGVSDLCPMAHWYSPPKKKKIGYEDDSGSSEFVLKEEEKGPSKKVEEKKEPKHRKNTRASKGTQSKDDKFFNNYLKKLRKKKITEAEPPTLDELEESNIYIRKKRTR
ncbi:unnamed protein product [Moneuplotes crassus]|uniref:Endonuclease III homolog n=1 Tax=Euplotes crassus TaxID=5936 RepID=A0AAD1UHF0_EUPCR|nr:unnamed protein product [Moneuplotes crassus]